MSLWLIKLRVNYGSSHEREGEEAKEDAVDESCSNSGGTAQDSNRGGWQRNHDHESESRTDLLENFFRDQLFLPGELQRIEEALCIDHRIGDDFTDVPFGHPA